MGCYIISKWVVVKNHADYLGCVPFREEPPGDAKELALHPSGPSLSPESLPLVYIAKPYELQMTPWHRKTATYNGREATFNYTGIDSRTVSYATGIENEVVVPPYVAGDLISAVQASFGLLDPNKVQITLLDMNDAKRAWAAAESVN